jgi:hypothetical protein
MTPNEFIDLVTPEADRKSRAQRSALTSLHVVTATSLFDLTADTPPPVSARGIADDENDHRGGDARDDSNRPPDIPRLHETRENARSITRHAHDFTPVTNSSSSPRRKKSRSLLRRYSGKENSSNNDSFLSSTRVENRKSPLENLTPVVDVLAGKKSSVTLSVSHLDSDTLSVSRQTNQFSGTRVTLSVSHLDSDTLSVSRGTNQFSGPREIPRFLDGVFMGQFLPQDRHRPSSVIVDTQKP